MATNSISSGSLDIAIAGLRAQRMKMKVITANIANADTSKGPGGKPYVRRDVVFGTSGSGDLLSGPVIQSVGPVKAPPGKAGQDGADDMTNVQLPTEMMHLMTASRAYQANAAVLKRFKESVEITLELLR